MIKIKNKILFLLLSVLLILILLFNIGNFKGFLNNILGNVFFNNKNYENALNYHKKAENYIKNNTINYNLGGDYYKLGDYNKSKEYYQKVETGTGKKEDLDLLYNLGNAFYKLGEKEQNIEDKVSLWKESLDNYKKILDEKEDKKTRENYDYVMKKLKELEDKQDKKEEGDEQQNEGKNESSEDKKESDNKDGEKKQEENSTEENKSGEGNEYDIKKDSKLKELSEEEKRQLEEYNEQLKQEQKENSLLFGKKNQNNNEDIFDMLKQDPLFGDFENFDNSILNQNEKDW